MRSIRLFQNASSSAARPISLPEFADALFKAWGAVCNSTVLHADETGCLTGEDDLNAYLRDRERQNFEPHPVGLAISGGVDSMALASLCSRLQVVSQHCPHSVADQLPDVRFLRPLKFRAFVVDHCLRPGSGLEAEAVSRVLEGRDIETQVLKIKWPSEVSPAKLPNFETAARAHRFQLLGKACWEFGIDSLLLAHHEDDQAETVIGRLSLGHGFKGLRGMRKSGALPACSGIHGLSESGGVPTLIGNIVGMTPALRKSSIDQLLTETGGIRVYRPFLDFSKARLEATCRAHNMQWFEDHTNKDPTLNPRNALRHIINNYTLPTALTKPAILSLSRRVTDKVVHLSEIAKSWLAKCQITGFETTSGTLKVRFADLNEFRVPGAAWPPQSGPIIAAHVVNSIFSLVKASDPAQDIQDLQNAVRIIFPELYQQKDEPALPVAFTTAGVYFKPLEVDKFNGLSPSTRNQKPEWLLSRQVHNRNRHPGVCFDIPKTKGAWSLWQLYDGRYWIRVQNLRQPILIKPLQPKSIEGFYASLADQGKQIKEVLNKIAPGTIRWTLPAIVTRGEDGEETVIALPSLGVGSVGCMVKWEIRYKKIYTDDLPKDIVLPRPMSHHG